MSDNSEFKYLNRPQMLAYLVRANKEYHILGRGTGKSSIILAMRALDNVFAMKGASGLNISDTYSRLLSRTMPAMIGGWAANGYIRDKHYVIGRRAPAAWRWPDPLEPPVKYDYYIQWYNGSGIHIGSQDVDGSTIGLNIQWIMGDEAKKLNRVQLDEETRPAMRGYRHLFYKQPQYRSECYTTSMPVKADERWILDLKKQMDPDLVKLILEMSYGLEAQKFSEADAKRINSALIDLRSKCLFYQEASSLENFAILGQDYFDDLRRSIGDFTFETEILNLTPGTIDGAYYPSFDLNRHLYKGKYNITHLESLDFELDKIKNLDCRQDADLVGSLPLKIAIDWGGHLNYMSVMQRQGSTVRIINELWTKPPDHIDHLAEKFAKYYWYHRTKELIFRYDRTGDDSKDNSNLTSAEQFIKKVKEIDKSWDIKWQRKEAAPTQHAKYHLGIPVLDEKEARLPVVRINEDKCEYLILSILNAPVKENSKGMLIKDKSSEKKWEKIDPLVATHASDAFDIHINAEFRHLVEPDDYYIGV
jgi:hypothetical protein